MKLDFGCGKNKAPGYIGVDVIGFKDDKGEDLVDVIMDAGKDPWPWADESVDEANASHFLEHLEPQERVHFVNELYRVLKKGGKLNFRVPHWASNRAYGDLTHKWPPVAEMWFFYLNKDWRAINAPHNDFYKCDFDAAWGYDPTPALATRNEEFRSMALQFFKEAAADMVGVLTKK